MSLFLNKVATQMSTLGWIEPVPKLIHLQKFPDWNS